MPKIELHTTIHAPVEICFDLARSIDLHKISTGHTEEQAVAGVTHGLIGLGEQVTWEARHFGIRQRLTSKITRFEYPFYFRDEMQKGAFKKLEHDHHFRQNGEITVMKDLFYFQSPGGILGDIFNRFVLTNYLRKLLLERNNIIKQVAESGHWKTYLSHPRYTGNNNKPIPQNTG